MFEDGSRVAVGDAAAALDREDHPERRLACHRLRVIDRRRFLVLSAAAGMALACSPRSEQASASKVVNTAFEPAETTVDLGGVSMRTWAYAGRVPGPEIRIRKGETLRAAVTNRLPGHHHSLARAGDPQRHGRRSGADPAEIAADQSFQYEFVVPDAGTYWCYFHVGTQLDRGFRRADRR